MPHLAVRTSLPKPDDPDILRRIAEATRKGHSIETAGNLAGLGKTVAWDWLRQGSALLDAAPPGIPAEELGSHAVFAKAVRDAEAEMVDAKLDVIHEDMHRGNGKGWLPAMTLLERRRPQDFGRFQRIEVEQRTVTLSLTAQYPPEVLAFLAQRMLSEATGGGSTPLPQLPDPAPTPDPEA